MARGWELKAQQGSRLKKEKARKVSSRLEKEIKYLRAESLGLDKAYDLQKKKARKASSRLENEIKQLKVESSRPKKGKKKKKSFGLDKKIK